MSKLEMTDIYCLAAVFKKQSKALEKLVEGVEDQQRQIIRRATPEIERVLAEAKAAKQDLETAISENKHLFEKPKTVSAHGVKVGLRKLTGTVEIKDEDHTLALIKQKLPDKENLLVKTSFKTVKAALLDLSVSELKSIGVSVVDPTDQVVIKLEEGDISKALKALMTSVDTEDQAA